MHNIYMTECIYTHICALGGGGGGGRGVYVYCTVNTVQCRGWIEEEEEEKEEEGV